MSEKKSNTKVPTHDHLYYTTQCRHFTGIHREVCAIGIRYDSLRDASGPGMAKWPCIVLSREPAKTNCIYLSRWTAEESAAMFEEDRRRIDEALSNLASDICPQCKTPVTTKRQVGPCVYGDPCGHRLYQGKI